MVENYNEVNIVGIYYGNEKPADANVFLKDFTEEAITLTIHGITINDHTYPFKINAFICDVLNLLLHLRKVIPVITHARNVLQKGNIFMIEHVIHI